MHATTIALLATLGVLAYLFVAGAAYTYAEKVWKLDGTDGPFPFFTAMFWPVVLCGVALVALPARAGSRLASRLLRPKPEKIPAPGVTYRDIK